MLCTLNERRRRTRDSFRSASSETQIRGIYQAGYEYLATETAEMKYSVRVLVLLVLIHLAYFCRRRLAIWVESQLGLASFELRHIYLSPQALFLVFFFSPLPTPSIDSARQHSLDPKNQGACVGSGILSAAAQVVPLVTLAIRKGGE